MQGVAFLIIGFFAACWVIVIGYHTGLLALPQLTSFTEGTLPLAYTGAAISVCGLAAAIVAGVLNK